MSRTYAHTPLWVEEYRRGTMQHDHSRGECTADRASTLAGARSRGYRSFRSHYPGACKKYTYTRVYCWHTTRTRYRLVRVPKASGPGLHSVGYEPYTWTSPKSFACEAWRGDTRVELPEDLPECKEVFDPYSTWDLRRRFPAVQRSRELSTPDEKGNRFHVYSVSSYDPDTPCECDGAVGWLTCSLELPWRETRKLYPADHDPWYDEPRRSRTSVRMDLDAYRHSWNAGEDLEVEEVSRYPLTY